MEDIIKIETPVDPQVIELQLDGDGNPIVPPNMEGETLGYVQLASDLN